MWLHHISPGILSWYTHWDTANQLNSMKYDRKTSLLPEIISQSCDLIYQQKLAKMSLIYGFRKCNPSLISINEPYFIFSLIWICMNVWQDYCIQLTKMQWNRWKIKAVFRNMIYFDTMDYIYCIPAQFDIQWISVLFWLTWQGWCIIYFNCKKKNFRRKFITADTTGIFILRVTT